MFYRGRELKNDLYLKDCGLQTVYKDEEGLEQKLAVCILCNISKITDIQVKEANQLQNQGKITESASYVEYMLNQETSLKSKNVTRGGNGK